MKKLISAVALVSVATIAFAQFYANWPETHESPSAAYIFAGIILFISLLLLVIGYRRENHQNLDVYHFRKSDDSEFDK